MKDRGIVEKIAGSKLILAYFSQPECTVCKTLRPKIETMVSDYPGIEFQYIDTLTHPVLRGQYMIFAVPTIIFFYVGKEVKRWSRFMAVHEIEEVISRYWDADSHE